jgi:phospholipase/carboxylesterase
MVDDTDELLEATTALVPALLTAMDALAAVGRHLHPPHLVDLVANVEHFHSPVADGLEIFRAAAWPEHLANFRSHIDEAAVELLQAFDGLARCTTQASPALGAYRAMRFNTRAVAALYPVSFMLPPVSRFYLSDPHRGNTELLEKIAAQDPAREEVGIMHADNAATDRGGFSLYVPEYYDAAVEFPLVVALHGGSGHGRSFLWSWLRDGRSRGVIIASPTSIDATWSLMGPDQDSANLDAIVDHICNTWSVDRSRILLTGMSDGGTFSYVSGLRSATAFTHLAPIAASFHPLLLEFAEAERLRDLPVFLIHGVLDWMFAVDMARTARDALTAAGAAVEYREIEDLSHTYPQEQNEAILDWMLAP